MALSYSLCPGDPKVYPGFTNYTVQSYYSPSLSYSPLPGHSDYVSSLSYSTPRYTCPSLLERIDRIIKARQPEECKFIQVKVKTEQKKRLNYDNCFEKYFQLIVKIQSQYKPSGGRGYRIIPRTLENLPRGVVDKIRERDVIYLIGQWDNAVVDREALGIDDELELFMEMGDLNLVEKTQSEIN